jgi:DNA-binding beta-propeller fold protein YncE
VFAIDTTTNRVVAQIPATIPPPDQRGYPTRITISRDGARAFVADDGETACIWVIDLATDTTIGGGICYGGDGPADIAVTSDGSRAYVADVDGTVSIIDTTSARVVSQLRVGDFLTPPNRLALTPDGARLFILTDVVLAIDTATNAVVGVPPIVNPNGIAVTPDGSRVYVTSVCGDPPCSTPEGFLSWFTPFENPFDSRIDGVVPIPGKSVGAVVVAPLPVCAGDCNGDGQVTVDEILTLVTIALGNAETSACPSGVPSRAKVNVALITQAVNDALSGCGG